MFETLRSAKAKKLTGWILVLMVVVPFIFYFGWSPSQQPRAAYVPLAAEVNGEAIEASEIPRIRQDLVLAMPGGAQALRSVGPEQLKQFLPDAVVVDEAIRSVLLAQMAKRHGLDLGPVDIEAALQAFLTPFVGAVDRLPVQQMNLIFNQIARDLYGYTPQRLEQHIVRQALRDRALRCLLYPQARTSVLELWQAYEEQNTLYRLDCAVFRVSQHLATEEITDAEIEEYYSAHPEEYTVAPRVVYDYLAVSRDDLADAVEVTEQEVSEEYRRNLRSYVTPAIYELSQIVLDDEGAADSPPAAVQAVVARLEAGEDFSALASELSVDEFTSALGGRMARTPEDLLAPEVVSVVSALATGEVSAPVHIGNHWILYRLESVTPAQTRSYEEVAPQIRQRLRDSRLDALFQERRDDLQEVFESASTLEDMAAALNLEIQTSPPVAPGAPRIAGIGSVEPIVDDLQALEVGEMLPFVYEGQDSAAVIRLREYQPRTTQPLDEAVRLGIRIRLAQIRAEEKAEDDAYALREAALSAPRDVSGEFFSQAAQRIPGLAERIAFEEVITEPFAPVGDNIAAVGLIAGLARALHYAPVGSLSEVKQIQQPGGTRVAGYVIWLVRERVTPSHADFYQELLELRSQEVRENQNRLVAEWYADALEPDVNEVVRHDLTAPR